MNISPLIDTYNQHPVLSWIAIISLFIYLMSIAFLAFSCHFKVKPEHESDAIRTMLSSFGSFGFVMWLTQIL